MTKRKMAAIVAALAVALGASALHAQTPAPAPTSKPAKPGAPRNKPAAPQAAPHPAPSTGKSLCVASIIGHKFNVQTIGLMVFGNALEEASIESWGLDDALVRKVTQLMGRQYSVRRLDVPKSVLAAYEGRQELFKDRNVDFIAGLRAAAGSKCDFVLTATRGGSAYAGTNQTLYGLGVLNHGKPINERVYVFVTYDLILYNGKDFSRLRHTWPSTDPMIIGALVGPGIRGMYRRVDNALWPSSAQAAAQSEQLKSTTRALVEEGVSKSVPGMFTEAVN